MDKQHEKQAEEMFGRVMKVCHTVYRRRIYNKIATAAIIIGVGSILTDNTMPDNNVAITLAAFGFAIGILQRSSIIIEREEGNVRRYWKEVQSSMTEEERAKWEGANRG